MPDSTVTKGPLKTEPALPTAHGDRKGPEIDINVPKGDLAAKPGRRTYDTGEGIYEVPGSSNPRKPNPVAGDFDPTSFNQPSKRMVVVVLEGGPLDGADVEVPQNAMKYDAVLSTDPEKIEPFEFDAEAHRLYVLSKGKEGKPNIIQGALDTFTYRRTNRRNEQGMAIFSAA